MPVLDKIRSKARRTPRILGARCGKTDACGSGTKPMQNRTTAPSVHTLLFLLLALLCGNGLRAQITYDNFLPKSGIQPGALLTVSDPDTTQTGPGVFVNRTQYLSLVYTTEAHTDVQNYTA